MRMLAGLLKGSVAMVLQFDWSKDAGSLTHSDLESAVFPLLLTLAHRIGKAAQQDRMPVNEAVTFIHSIIQVRESLPLNDKERFVSAH